MVRIQRAETKTAPNLFRCAAGHRTTWQSQGQGFHLYGCSVVKLRHSCDSACWTMLPDPSSIDLVEQRPLFNVSDVNANLHKAAPIHSGLPETTIDVSQHLFYLIRERMIRKRRAGGIHW